ncbi:MAG TPA: hypothetical protein VHT91_47700 [Kofleriaceae bacterium]|nr:hypothetical protein [Kofleriaceae bacterium]
MPTQAAGDRAGPAPRRPDGPPANAADRAAARQAAEAAAQALAAHGAALAAQARAAGQQVAGQIAGDVDLQRQRVIAAAQAARSQVEPIIAAQRAAVTARATAEKARIATAVATQRAAIQAAAQAQRTQATEQIGLAIGWAVGAIVGLFIASSTVAAIVTAVILIGGAIGIAIYARFQEFYADNPGQDAGFWRGLGLVGLGIADLTGIPYMIEGIVGQRAFGAKMNTAQSAERFGMGLVFLITAGIATWRGVKWFRGRAPTTPPVERPPVERPPADPNQPPVDPNQAPADPSRAPADPTRAAGDPDQAPADPNRPGRPAARPEAPRGWRGTLNEFGKRLRWPARSAKAPNMPGPNEIPVGEVNLDEVRAMGVDEAWARQQAQVYRDIAGSEIGRNNPSARPRAEWLEALADRLRAQPRGPGLTVTPQPPPPRDHDDEN